MRLMLTLAGLALLPALAMGQGLLTGQDAWYRGYFEGRAYVEQPGMGYSYEPVPGSDWAMRGYWTPRSWGGDGHRGRRNSYRLGRDWDRALPGQYWDERPGRYGMPIGDTLRWPNNLRTPPDPRQTQRYREQQERVRRAGHLW